mgnify:CR=1 FL=1
MKKLSETYKDLGIAFDFPIEIRNENGNLTYHETSDGFWCRCEYDENGKDTYREDSDGFWCRCEYDENGNLTYFENSAGTKHGTKHGTKRGSCSGKVIEIDGKKYKLTEL